MCQQTRPHPGSATAQTEELIAGFMSIDADSYKRAVELAGELSAAAVHDCSADRQTNDDASVATINFLDENAQPQRVDNVPLPWSHTLTTDDPTPSPISVHRGPVAPSVAASPRTVSSRTKGPPAT
jgi:hypothetical protein